jgi:signal transduction histidine kinase
VVSARRTGSLLVLAVEDDGAPPAGAAVARGDGPPQGAGIGLRLIRERLAALYGGAASLETGRSPLGGFRASVTLPFTGATGSRA